MSRRDYVAFLALLVLVVALSLAVGATREDQRDALPSSFINSSGGVAVLHGVFEVLELGAERLLSPLLEPDTLPGPLLMLAPSQQPTPRELRALAAWIRDGGTLIYAAHPRDAALDTLGLRLEPIGPEARVLREAGRRVGEWAFPGARFETEGLEAVGPFRFAFEDETLGPEDVVLLTTPSGEVVALRRAFGSGVVVAFSDVRPLLNGFVGDGGAATVLVRAAASAGGRPVFDEYHHGFRSGGSPVAATLAFLTATGPGNALLQVAAALVGVLLLHGTRFGSPLPGPSPRRRNPLEHVDALAAAYARAGARRTASRLIVSGMLRRIGMKDGDDHAAALVALPRGLPSHAADDAEALGTEYARGEDADLARVAELADRIISHKKLR